MPVTPPAQAPEITSALREGTRWGPVEVVASTVSTNLDVTAAAAAGADPGLVIVSNHQESGRGRFTRTWVDVPGTAVALSALVRPTRPAPEWGWLALAAGISVAAAIRDLAAVEADRVAVKWPNDVLVDGRKVCGILCESDGRSVAIGIGINVSMDETELPVPQATSLLLAGFPTDKNALVAGLLNHLDHALATWEETGDLTGEYAATSATIGSAVRVLITEDDVVEGTAVGIGLDGELLVETDAGLQSFAAGDVTHLRPAAR